MTKGHRTIVALLAAVVVLLVLNLLSDHPEAEAQTGGPVRLVSMSVVGDTSTHRVWRAWSNGDVDATWVRFNNNVGSTCQIVDFCGPVSVIP